MWMAIFSSVIIALTLCVIYLLIGLKRFTIIKKTENKNKHLPLIITFAVIAALFALLTITMGIVNCVICIIHLVIFWIFCDIVCFIIKKIRKKEFKRYWSGMSAFLITIGYMSFGWYCAHHVSLTSYTIDTDKDAGSIRIVQFADSHIGTTFDANGFAEHLKEIQEQKPDVVLITGDFVDDGTSREDMLEACKALSTLETKYGVYFSYGNHDRGYYSEESRGWSVGDLENALTENGVVILEDESVLIDDRFYITGRKDLSFSSRMTMSELTKDLNNDKYIIVMDHQPHDYDAQAEAGVNLVLSGHTHGGQFFPINRAGEWMGVNCRTYGQEKRENTEFIVTSGISDWALDFKTGCKSEYVVIDIK